MSDISLQNTIFEILREYEPERCRRLRRLIISEIVCCCLFPFCAYIFGIYLKGELNGHPPFSGFIAVLAFFVMAISGGNVMILPFIYNADFKEYIKEQCSGKILALFPSIQKANQHCDADLLRCSHLFGSYSSIVADDCFDGEHNGQTFSFDELTLLSRYLHSKSIVFNGGVLHFKTRYNLKSLIVIAPKYDFLIRGFSFSLFWVLFCVYGFYQLHNELSTRDNIGWALYFVLLIGSFGIGYYFHYMRKVKLESIDFEKKYKVYATNQVQSRRLLTPVFMEKFAQLKIAFGTGKVKCAFFDNHVMIAISAKHDLFEFDGLLTRLDNPQYECPFYKEVRAIFDLIDYFDFKRQ